MAGGSGGKREGFILQNVNVLLGGAMLSGLVLLVCLVCCCCRYTATRKPPADSPSSYWLQDATVSPDEDELACERELDRGIYTVDVQCARSLQAVWPSPPPPYSALRLAATAAESTSSLPTYEAATQQQRSLTGL